MTRRLSLACALLSLWPLPALAQLDADALKNAKALFFDRKYAEARQAWQAVLARARGADAEAAAFWIARSSEYLGEHERALREYDAFLARRPSDRLLAEEARTNRVGLAARLYKAGQRQHLSLLEQGLDDPSQTVRYYAAFQMAGLGPPVGRKAVPVLLHILDVEHDDDLVERAKLYLLRLDPRALSRAPQRGASTATAARMLRVRVYERDKKTPAVSVNLPLALAELAFKSLPEEAIRELHKKGYDAANFWEQLKKMGPTEILSIEGDEGERVQIWIE